MVRGAKSEEVGGVEFVVRVEVEGLDMVDLATPLGTANHAAGLGLEVLPLQVIPPGGTAFQTANQTLTIQKEVTHTAG